MAATPGAGEQTVSRMDVLNYGGETSAARLPRALQAAVRDAQNRAAVLRDIQRRQNSREAFGQSLTQKEGERRFDLGSVEEMKSRFGAGESEVGATTKRAKVPVSPEKRAVFNEAARIIENNAIIMRYLDIVRSNEPNTNAYFQSIKANNPSELQNIASFAALRTRALTLIALDNGFQDIFPEFANNPPTPQTLQVIEDTLVDDRLNSRLKDRMAVIYEKTLDFAKVETNQERTETESNKRETKEDYDAKADELVKVLARYNINQIYIPPGAARPVNLTRNPERIKDVIKSSVNESVAMESVVCAALNCTLEDYSELTKYINFPNQNREIQDRIQAKIGKQRNVMNFINNPANAGDADVAAYRASTREANRLSAKFRAPGGGRLTQDQQLFRTFNSSLRILVQPSSSGATPYLESLTRQIKGDEKRLEQLDKDIKALPRETPDIRDSKQKRLMQENDLINELGGALGQSIRESMEERYDKMMPLREQQAEDEARQAKEAGDLEKAKCLQALTETMQTRWVRMENGRRNADRRTIGADMRELMYAPSKEEGLKRMMLERVRLQLGIAPAVDLNNMDLDTGYDLTQANPVRMITEEQLGRFNEIYAAKGKAFTDKLFADYFMSRDARDNMWRGDLNFSGAEWVLLQQKFDQEINDGIQANTNARTMVERMREEGYMNNFQRRLLIYLLFVVLGIGTGGVGAVALGGGIGALGGLGAAAAVATGGGILGGAAAGAGSGAAEGVNYVSRQAAGAVQQRVR